LSFSIAIITILLNFKLHLKLYLLLNTLKMDFFKQDFNSYDINHPMSIETIITKINNESLNVHPSYQRELVWTLEQQKKILNTLSRGGFITAIIVNMDEDNKYEVVDGQNRITTIKRFMENDIVYDWIIYNELSDTEKRKFNDIHIPTIKLIHWNKSDCEEVFEYIQFGVKPTLGEIIHAKSDNNLHKMINLVLEDTSISEFLIKNENISDDPNLKINKNDINTTNL